jgi:hypothetical protein
MKVSGAQTKLLEEDEVVRTGNCERRMQIPAGMTEREANAKAKA